MSLKNQRNKFLTPDEAARLRKQRDDALDNLANLRQVEDELAAETERAASFEKSAEAATDRVEELESELADEKASKVRLGEELADAKRQIEITSGALRRERDNLAAELHLAKNKIRRLAAECAGYNAQLKAIEDR